MHACRRGPAGRATPAPGAGRRPSSRSRSGRRGRSRPRSCARRVVVPERRRGAVSVPSASSSAKPRSTPITAPPPRRGRTAAATSPTWRRSTVPSVGQREDVAGEHVDPAQAAPGRRPDRPLAVVGDRVGHLFGAHPGSMPPAETRRTRAADYGRAASPSPPRPGPGRGPARASPPTPSGCWPASGSSTTWPAGARPARTTPSGPTAWHCTAPAGRRPGGRSRPSDLAGVLGRPGPPVLVDCFTTWLAGTMDSSGVWDEQPGADDAAGRRRRRAAGSLVLHPPAGGRGEQRGGQRDRAGHRVGTAVPRRDGGAQRPARRPLRSGSSW